MTVSAEDEEQARRLDRSIRDLMHVLTVRAQDIAGDGRAAFSATEFSALSFLHDHPGAMGREVTAFLGLTATTVQSLLDRLARRGLLSREPHVADGRAVALRLTGEGVRAVNAIRDQDIANCHAMLAALPQRRRREIVDDIETIAAAISARR
ncbi:MAG: MarR family transcriptional regulator [Pseudomonadota bacterium]